MDVSCIYKYFPELTDEQQRQFAMLQSVYSEWNEKINVISRKDMDDFYEHHVLHSLAIAKCYQILPGMKVLDVGTGGGFPGIPLAIMFPQTDFLLVDGIGKKITVAKAVIEALGLKNVEARQERAENVNDRFDVIVSRAVTNLPDFVKFVNGKLRCKGDKEAGGVFYLKGGDIQEELAALRGWKNHKYIISKWFREPYFEEKYVVHLF